MTPHHRSLASNHQSSIINRQSLWVLVGPTGVGKSPVALKLARLVDGEILVADSMQVYRGMDIGTGKPSRQDQAAVPHHGVDLVAPEIEFSVAMYRRYAVATLKAIVARGRTPILVGGTGLYVRAVIDGLCPAPPADPRDRECLVAEAAARGVGHLYGRLQETDPDAAARIHPYDARRIIRALEVYQTTGRTLSDWQRQTRGLGADWVVSQIGLIRPRPVLYARIEARVRAMVASGWIEEVQRLFQRGVGRTAACALGYQQLLAAFEGRWSVDEAIARTERDTRRYARRQLTWFRRDPRIQWLELREDESPLDTAQRILSFLGH